MHRYAAALLALSFPCAARTTPGAANQNVFAQGIADIGGSLVLTAPAVTRTQ